MASKNPRFRLIHMQDEIIQLTAAFDGVDYPKFVENYLLRRATEHALLILSEAARALPDNLIEPYSSVDWISLRGIGNILRHDYYAVEPIILWRIVSDHLPALEKAVAGLIADMEAGSL